MTQSVHNFPSLAADVIDEETLEPFYEQKMACKRLIEYLTSLQSRMPVECSSSSYNATDKTCKQITVDGSEGWFCFETVTIFFIVSSHG